MKGSVTKYYLSGAAKPRWRFRVYTGRDDTGKKVYEGKGGFPTQRDAAEAMRAHMVRLDIEAKTEPEATFGAWLADWVTLHATLRCSPKTIERYTQLASYVVPARTTQLQTLADLPMSRVTQHELEAALVSLLNSTKGHRPLSVQSVRHVAALFRAALNKAIKLDLIATNPMRKVELPRLPQADTRSLSIEEMQTLRKSCRNDWTFAFVELALATGCRRGELLALEWEDFDSGSNLIYISKSLEQTRKGLRIKSTKNSKRRMLTLPPIAAIALEQHRNGGVRTSPRLMFCDEEGNHLLPNEISHVIIRRLRKAGIRKASLHTLRHTHASTLLSQGMPLPAVSARLGHANPQITAKIYSHALPGDDKRVADAWEGLITVE